MIIWSCQFFFVYLQRETIKRLRNMAKNRKYVRYQLVAEFGTINEESENYHEIATKYFRTDAPKTLYGITEQGDFSVIFSKG